MILYTFDFETREYLQKMEANELYGTDIPFTTDKKPLKSKDGFAICFNESSNSWEYVVDFRKKKAFNKNNKNEVEIHYLGELKPEHTLLNPSKFDKWDENRDSWVEDVELKAEFEKAQKRDLKQEKLKNLTVTTENGNTFDGNETARNNMLSAIQTATYLNQTKHNWKMADNSVVLITLDELKEALALAIKKVGEIVTGEE